MPIELSATQPWPGLATYEEDARAFFHGRESETDALVQLIRMAPLTVLYGRSGLGKSSLLKAGVFPLLRAQCFLPVYLRLNYGSGADVDPVGQIGQRLAEEIAAAGLEAPARDPAESLWHWLHRKDFELWSADNRLWTPVLVFDQFEELFSRTGGNVQLISEVFDTLADLAENRIEQGVADSRRGRDALDLIGQRYRMLLSFREDFLPDVRAWERQVPSLLRNDLRLVAMSREQAVGAVRAAGGDLLAPKAAERLVDFVGALAASTRSVESGSTTLSGRRAELTIEPALLSLCGAQLARRVAPGQKIDAALLKQVGFNILEGFYRDALADMPDSVQVFIEDYLLQGDRTRGSYARDEALEQGFISAEQLALLTEQRRLLRVAQEGGVPRIELIHDRLVDVVKGARDRRNAVRQTEAARRKERREAADRLAAEQAARLQVETKARADAEHDAARIARKNQWLGGVAAVMLVAMSVAIWQAIRSEQRYEELQAKQAELQVWSNGYLRVAPKASEFEALKTGYDVMRQQFRDLTDALSAVRIWNSRSGGGAPGLDQVLRAHDELVARTAAFVANGLVREVKPATVAIHLAFEPSSPQRELLQRSFDQWKFDLKLAPLLGQGNSGVVLAGSGALSEDIRIVALSLIRAGIPVRAVERLGAANPNAYPASVRPRAGAISVVPEGPVAPASALTVERITSADFIR